MAEQHHYHSAVLSEQWRRGSSLPKRPPSRQRGGARQPQQPRQQLLTLSESIPDVVPSREASFRGAGFRGAKVGRATRGNSMAPRHNKMNGAGDRGGNRGGNRGGSRGGRPLVHQVDFRRPPPLLGDQPAPYYSADFPPPPMWQLPPSRHPSLPAYYGPLPAHLVQQHMDILFGGAPAVYNIPLSSPTQVDPWEPHANATAAGEASQSFAGDNKPCVQEKRESRPAKGHVVEAANIPPTPPETPTDLGQVQLVPQYVPPVHHLPVFYGGAYRPEMPPAVPPQGEAVFAPGILSLAHQGGGGDEEKRRKTETIPSLRADKSGAAQADNRQSQPDNEPAADQPRQVEAGQEGNPRVKLPLEPKSERQPVVEEGHPAQLGHPFALQHEQVLQPAGQLQYVLPQYVQGPYQVHLPPVPSMLYPCPPLLQPPEGRDEFQHLADIMGQLILQEKMAAQAQMFLNRR